jgi:DAK2 domain fusion protein YloV
MKVLNGQKFKMLVISAANNLYNHYPEIDALNVFPVPDGDTGMNMNLTLSSGAKEVMNRNDTNIYDMAKAFSKGLLMGARGNSGVITSQIFRGFADSLVDKSEINAVELAEAFDNGRKIAYKAVIKPVEGTILTVIRESSSYLLNRVDSRTTIEEAFSLILKEAEESLARTPNLLPVLKEVGVVDSGGAGLVRIFEGMDSAINGEFIEKNAVTAVATKGTTQVDIDDFDGLVGNAYKLEMELKLGPEDTKKQYQKNRFAGVLASHGKNIDISDDNGVVTIKMITNNPGNILSYAQNYGEFINLKISNIAATRNMKAESQELLESMPNDLIDQAKNSHEAKEYALIATSSGPGIDKLFNEVGVNYIVSGGQTMNPSTEDFVKAIKQTNAKVCFIYPNNSNIILAANQAKDVCKGQVDVEVIPTKTIMQGVVSSMMFTPDVSKEENVKSMNEAIKSVKTGSVTFSIKDTDINGMHVNKDEFMAIRESKTIISTHKNKLDALKALLTEMIDENSAIITCLIGKDVDVNEEVEVRNFLTSSYRDYDVDIRRGDQPVYSFIVGVE